MVKPKIKLCDTLFPHGTSISSGDLKIHPTYFDYYRGEGKTDNQDIYDDIVLITESSFHLVDSLPHKIKIGWITEPPQIDKKIYEEIKNPKLYNKFTYIMTYIQELLELDKKFVFTPSAGCWIYGDDWKIYKKNKNISIIASDKKQTDGHRYRHEIIERFGNKIAGIYGRGYKEIDYKLEGLKDFRYQIVVENEKRDLFFSEKLIDCFATGVIPIFWGCPSINSLFNKEGILSFETLDELEYIIKKVATIKNYKKSISAIHDNLKIASQYAIMEDWIYKNIPLNLL